MCSYALIINILKIAPATSYIKLFILGVKSNRGPLRGAFADRLANLKML